MFSSCLIISRQTELQLFLDQVRKKFLGFGDMPNDNDTLIGLPAPIHESVKILKQVFLCIFYFTKTQDRTRHLSASMRLRLKTGLKLPDSLV
jgi:hypothetical protein